MSLPNVNIVLAPGRSSVTSHKSFDYQRKSSVPVPLKRPAVGSEPAFQTFQSISEFVQHAVERRKKGVHSMPSTSIEQNQSIDIVLQAHGESASDIGRATGRTSLENGRHQSSQELKPIDQDREVSTSYSESLDQIFQASAVAAQEYKNRLSMLVEESASRPVSSYVTTDDAQFRQRPPVISEMRPLKSVDDAAPEEKYQFASMNFIQMGSQELLYEKKVKTPKVIANYVLGETLGEGSYGKVKEGFCINNLKRVAVKIMKQSKLKKIPGGEQNVKREITLLKRLRHPNVVQLMDVIYNNEKQKSYVVFEYCASTLQELIARGENGKLPLSQSQRYFQQIVEGVKYLHGSSVVHRDIKSGNLLVTIDETIKISDFGVAEAMPIYEKSDFCSTSAGSPAFQPPEVALGKELFSGAKVDIWAIGVTLYNMISGRYPFDGQTIYALLDNIAKGEYTLPEEADSVLVSLLKGVLEPDPDKRLDLNEISEHIWLKAEIPRDVDEVPVIPYLVPIIHLNPETSGDQEPGASDLVVSVEPEAFNRHAPPGHLSNPSFAYDTTLVPFLETMFADLTVNYRRSSKIEADLIRSAFKQNNSLTTRFIRSISRPQSTSSNESASRPSSITGRPSRPNTPSFLRADAERCKIQ